MKGVAELGIRIETLTPPSGKVEDDAKPFASVDSGGSDQKIVGNESQIKQGSSHGADAATIAGSSGAGAAIGGLADHSWHGGNRRRGREVP